MSQPYRGIYSIPVTPFASSGEVDHAALADVVAFSLATGAAGLVMPVNVSEFYTLTEEERRTTIATTVSAAAGAVPVVAGVTGASTAQAAAASAAAREAGADAVIAMPPFVRRAPWSEVVDYYRAIAASSQLPVFVQNAEGPAGTPLTASQLLDLIDRIDEVAWVKEETLRSSQVITELTTAEGENGLAGVMGGKGSRFLLDEHPRGICGTMPGCEFTDLHAAVWDALEAGDTQRAHELHRFLLPLASMEDQYGGAAFCKEVLKRRGVIDAVGVREPGSPRLDHAAGILLDRLLDQALDAIGADLKPGHR